MKDSVTTFVSQIGLTDFIDVAIIAFVIYNILRFIRETRAEQLVKGLIILVVATLIAGAVHLYALNWILKNLMQFGIIALVIVFQPELRRALEYLGRSKLLRGKLRSTDKEKAKAVASAVKDAVEYFSESKTGAIIVIERDVTLNDFAETGVFLDSDLTAELLENIFYEGAPLHDGAVIVSDERIKAAGCVLPLTKSKELPTELGMRHRAALGITEVSDAYSIVVSEETGVISVAKDGRFTRFIDEKTLEKDLLDMYLKGDESIVSGLFKAFEKGGKDASKQ